MDEIISPRYTQEFHDLQGGPEHNFDHFSQVAHFHLSAMHELITNAGSLGVPWELRLFYRDQ